MFTGSPTPPSTSPRPRFQPSTVLGSTNPNINWDNPLVPGHWSQNAWLRLFVGLAVAEGAFLCVRRLIEASFLVLGPTDQMISWRGWSGFIAWHSLHVATIFFGALVAGSGQPLWLFYGSALGFISAMLSLILTLGKHTMVPDMMLLGVIMLEMGAAVFGAWLGAFIWKPLTAVKVDQPVDRRQAAAAARRMAPYKEFALSFNFLSFRLNWGRILIGTIVAAVGYTFARQIFDAVVNQFRLGGALDHAPEVRVNVLRDLIGGVSVMLGGMIAGSSSKAGPAHGIWLALLSCGFVVVHNYLLRDVPLRTDELSPHLMLVAFLCLLGGFLGSRLMPPIAKVQPGKAPARRNVEI